MQAELDASPQLGKSAQSRYYTQNHVQHVKDNSYKKSENLTENHLQPRPFACTLRVTHVATHGFRKPPTLYVSKDVALFHQDVNPET